MVKYKIANAFLYWVEGFTHLADGILIIVSLGAINPDFTGAVRSEIKGNLLKMAYPWINRRLF